MNGVYGDMLLHFAEQNRSVSVFDMVAKINGGWDIVTDDQGNPITTTIIGIYQNTTGDSIKDSNGNLVKAKGLEFWCHEGELDGKFLTYTNGNIYRLKASNDWSFEGGFYRYSLEKVVGNNGTESDDTTWNTGANFFD